MEVIALVVSAVSALGAVGAGAFALGQMRAAGRSATASEESAEHARRSADTAVEAVSYQRAEIERRDRAALVPPGELLDQMLNLERDLGDIIAAGGGQESLWFLDHERQNHRSRLAALAIQVRDDDLNAYLGEARSSYHSCWAMAPGYDTDNPTARSQEQAATAGRGRTFLTKAIDRYGTLVRDAAAPSSPHPRGASDPVLSED